MVKEQIVVDLLKDRGLRVTPKRLELLMLIANYDSAIPYSVIQKKLKGFDRVTLYRTIKALLDNAIIHKATVTTDDVYYAMCKHYCSNAGHKHKHVHFKCLECLEVSCVEVSNTIAIDIPNVVIKEVAVEISGVCARCC